MAQVKFASDPDSVPKGEARRRALLDAALRVIGQGGVEAITHRRVAEEAGVSRGAVTHHFGSRDAIVVEAFRYYIRIVASHLDEAMEKDSGEGLDGVIEWMVRYQQREFLDPQLVLAEYELILFAARSEELGPEYRAWERSLIGSLAISLERAGFPNAMSAARLGIGVFRAFELECLTHPERKAGELRERLHQLFTALHDSAASND